MDRAVLSQRITSILSDLNRLTNTLYALNMTDIQRYPENYEVLSTDAALRAEKITCRLRHLIYSTTNIKKEEYLASATVMQGIEIKYENEILEITLPCLLPKRKQKQGTEFLLDPFTAALSQYAKANPMPKMEHCVSLAFRCPHNNRRRAICSTDNADKAIFAKNIRTSLPVVAGASASRFFQR